MIAEAISAWGMIAILSALVLLVSVLKAAQTIRQDRGRDPRGSAPGTGYHVIDASYHSGGAGGGHSAEFRVPKDPQEYAQMFVPKNSEEPRR
jgi:hypothetical protein